MILSSSLDMLSSTFLQDSKLKTTRFTSVFAAHILQSIQVSGHRYTAPYQELTEAGKEVARTMFQITSGKVCLGRVNEPLRLRIKGLARWITEWEVPL
jgi:hypothetical protein